MDVSDKKLMDATKGVLLVLLVGGTMTLVWAIWTLWPSAEAGPQAARAAKLYLSKGVLIGLVLSASVTWQRRRTPADQREMRRLLGWITVAALGWAAMHAAAMMALPVPAPPTAAQGR